MNKPINNISDLFPGANTIAMAGLFLSSIEASIPLKISDFISIIPTNEDIEKLYLPRIKIGFRKPNYYLVGIAKDKRYWLAQRDINNYEDALSSITLAYLSLCIFNERAYDLGPIFGFNSEGSITALVLSKPTIAGVHWELKNEVLFRQLSPIIHKNIFDDLYLNENFFTFYDKVCRAYPDCINSRWFFSANKYLSGITQQYAHDSILDLAVSMEALVNRGKEQVSFSTKLYMSLLVGKDYLQRREIYKNVGDFYNLRSRLAHGANIKLKEKDNDTVVLISDYIAKALIMTCGKDIEIDVHYELENMSLSGMILYGPEKTNIKLTIIDVIDVIIKEEGLVNVESYQIKGLESFKGKDSDLTVKFKIDGKMTHSFYITYYLSFHPKLKDRQCISYVITKEDHNIVFLISIDN